MSKKKKNRALNTIAFVPNSAEGNRFLSDLQRYLNHDHHRMRIHSRGPRAVHATKDGEWRRAYDQDLPRKYAVWFAVYIDHKNRTLIDSEELEKLRVELYGIRRQLRNAGLDTTNIERISKAFDLDRPIRKFRSEE